MAFPPTRLSVPAGPSDTDDIDNISLASTDYGVNSEDQDKEWTVADLYADRAHPERPGERQYLIKWDGFPIDQCTWEPVENLGPGLLAQWEEIQEEIATGQRLPFDIEIYNTACREKAERHERRNAKRKRLGLPLTAPLPLESPTEDSSTMIASGDEMDLDGGLKETSNVGNPTPKIKPQKIVKQKMFIGIPTPTEASSVQNKNKNKRAPTHPISSKPTQRPPKPKRASSGDGGIGTTMTGYQGTARKPSTDTKKTSNQTASNSTSKAPSSLPPKMSSSLANKFSGKRHTATRTQPQTATLPTRKSNVFIGGKERKKRASLGDVMDDPSKAPKAFNSMRVMNIAKKRGIERMDGAHLDISSIPPSFFVTNDQRSRPNPGQTNASSPVTPIANAPIVQSPTAISPSGANITTPTLKAKKSVRFTGAQDDAPEDTPMGGATDDGVGLVVDSPMDIEHPPGTPDSVKVHPSRRLSLATYQERGQTQVVLKTVVFGKSGSEPIQVLFCGMTRQVQPWLSAFMAQETFHFDSICSSYNFVFRKGALMMGETLSDGTVEAKSKELSSTLSNVAEHLRRNSYGSHLITEQFSILVYPSNCDGWNELGVDISKLNPESHLRYIIYKSRDDMKLYPPASVPRAPTRLSHVEQGSHCRVLIKDLLGLDFSLFLPQNPKEKDNQVFMLLFPEREKQVCNMIKLWLRSCQPACQIFTHEIKDSWVHFHETVQAGKSGTIILHEDVSTSIRKLPRIFQMIDNKHCYTLWDLATGQYNPPRFPSDIYASIEPGTLQLTRLFPQGRAFLITPSFALSDPVRLHKFLEWFRNYCCNPHYLIMACADFLDYLKVVTLEKEAERKRMCLAHKNNPHLEELLAESGLGKQELEARFRAWEALKGIIADFGDGETSEEIRKVEWVTDFIDPNDEQSLVNYFCWWSSLKCDRYRKFTVLGSNNNKNRAAYRNIEIPIYTEETVNDPDIASAREKSKKLAHDASVPPGSASSASSPHAFLPRSSLSSGSATELKQWITSLPIRLPRKGNWAKLHYKPVSWLNVPMADHFGDLRCEYDTFKNWLGAAHKFSNINTWYGLFYTIDDEWNPQLPPSSYRRHPWVAVLRPRNPHFNSVTYAEVELFIWDIFAHDRESGRGKATLLNMQRHLIDLVRREISLKDSRYYLGEVYMSSKTNLKYNPKDKPLDFTKRMVEEMMADGKQWLPPIGSLLPDKGWIRIPKYEWHGGVAYSKTQKQKPIPKYESDENKLQRSIWHAPRPGTKLEKSACVNDLYEAAYSARAKDPSCQTMRYQYRSTLDWYHDMKAEGRDSSHVQVDSADRILTKLFQKK
ncbi:uncharacterized protein F4817DRAFT_330523 [Daldinia loculata]|uniref:uncharacterized protein n=1 Tax=Daldinia loculata TaxID=103429 RepID=UPI0020C4EEB5|nr:uncharacterized protein F4817DRAFT_330523 [Daldinia loculata]KAI1649486.1 hypothetical protein F4817DRAFT_330523 [Daldinia loculata]